MLDPPAGVRVQARVHEMNGPVLGLLVENGHAARGQLDDHAAAQDGVVEEIALDDLSLVAESDVEILEPVVREVLHDVPEHGTPADLHHRLRSDLGLLRKAGAESPRKDHDLHRPGPRAVPRAMAGSISGSRRVVHVNMGRTAPGIGPA